jgi:hypothetical protein
VSIFDDMSDDEFQAALKKALKEEADSKKVADAGKKIFRKIKAQQNGKPPKKRGKK